MPLHTPTIDTIGATEGRFASTYREAGLGPVGLGEVSFLRDWSVTCDDVGTNYYIHLPLAGRFDSRHRGVDLTHTREATAVLRPGGGSFAGRWAAGYHALCVRLDLSFVDAALTRLLGDRAPARVTFGHTMNTAAGPGRDWADLLLSVNRQSAAPDSLLRRPLVAAPLAESLVNGFLLAATHTYSEELTIPAGAARPAAVRTAVDLIEADPRAPLTVSLLASACDVSVRTLQNGFRRHLGMPPMAYVREVRLRRAHEELRAADPATESVAAVARRWGFGHLGRFAAAHEAKYGLTPLRTLRG
ncbi:helix-turn-helix transcriptional regulator [Streptomyces liangshanensis]|uniref:helix-turn-helix transcriptional regulator n=1 Tax=Streptomyces liangshanensis TaxID=2717324 RepID=UPI0036D7EC9B